MRKDPLVTGECYHIFNRGVDKRQVFMDKEDLGRFMQSMRDFNREEPIGSIYEYEYALKTAKANFGHSMSKKSNEGDQLVEIICYCLNPNHYHFLVRQVADQGIERFMQRLGNGYTKYFNLKYNRSGALFQGRFKSVHIGENEQLLHTSVYVNLNFRVHRYGETKLSLVRSSWDDYVGTKNGEVVCGTESILGQFQSRIGYQKFAERTLPGIIERKQQFKEMFSEK